MFKISTFSLLRITNIDVIRNGEDIQTVRPQSHDKDPSCVAGDMSGGMRYR